MQSLLWQERMRPMSSVCCFALLLFLLVACGSNAGTGSVSGQGTHTANAQSAAHATPTPSGPAIQYGAQTCPAVVSAPTYWDPIVPTQATLNTVESVSCGYMMGIPQLQAVVLVRSVGSGAALDVRVYNNITSPTPARVFLLRGLVHGDAKISGYNTLMTNEVDVNSLTAYAAQPDLQREFKWSDGAATLVPVAFPGIFPDMTRYGAEADQQKVNQGQQGWMLDATLTAQHFVASRQLLKWPLDSQVTIASGGGKNDTNASLTVKSAYVPPGLIKITMSRLENNTNGGIWMIASVSTDGMTLTTPQSLDHVSSPIAVKGSGNAFESVVGQIVVLDHLYAKIGTIQANGTGNGNTTFTANTPYTSTFKNGAQEGLIVLYSYSNADGSISGAVFVKTLLN